MPRGTHGKDFAARDLPPAGAPFRAAPSRAKSRWPTGGGSNDSNGQALTNPQSLVISNFNFSPSSPIQATSRARGLRLCRMVRAGESRQSFPLPGEPSLGPCLSLPDGAERSLAGRINGPLCVNRFRYGPTPRPRPAFALGSHLRGFSF